MTKQEAMQELAKRKLEEMHEVQSWSLLEFVKFYREKEKKVNLDMNWHLEIICQKLEDVFDGKIKRLMINIPPRSLKTEIVSIAFPAWCLGKRNNTKFMGISYSSGLAQDNSSSCRSMYESDTYLKVFPRKSRIKEDQNTKQYWTTENGWQYYASWSTGTITGKGCDIMVIDDPLKPDEAMSDIKRTSVNNNYHNTLKSRLNSKTDGAIVIIMQRLHDDDLCWHLIDQELKGSWEKWEKVIVPAIAEVEDEYRASWESFFPKRFPIEILSKIRTEDPQWFSTQYQQEPVNKETQEFHEERFKYHWEWTPKETPKWLRIFTAVDPAFKTGQENDQSCIMTVWLIGHEVYILEYTAGRFPADVLQEKIIYHIRKRNPEKVGIEAYQAQSMIGQFLKLELQKRWLYSNIVEIKQTGDKSTKLRKLISPYRNWDIYHKNWMDELELELKRFPRGKHDDIIDSLQMVYEMIELHPWSWLQKNNIRFERDDNGTPILIWN